MYHILLNLERTHLRHLIYSKYMFVNFPLLLYMPNSLFCCACLLHHTYVPPLSWPPRRAAPHQPSAMKGNCSIGRQTSIRFHNKLAERTVATTLTFRYITTGKSTREKAFERAQFFGRLCSTCRSCYSTLPLSVVASGSAFAFLLSFFCSPLFPSLLLVNYLSLLSN